MKPHPTQPTEEQRPELDPGAAAKQRLVKRRTSSDKFKASATGDARPIVRASRLGGASGAVPVTGRPAPVRSEGKMRPQKLQETDEQYAEKKKLFEDSRGKGKKLYDDLMQVVSSPETAQDRDLDAEFEARYFTTEKARVSVPSNLSEVVPDPRGYTEYSTNTKGMEGKPAAYANYVNAKEGVLIGGSNYADKEGQGPGKRLNNSEILFQQYKMGSGGHVEGLKEVVRSSIANQNTMNIINMSHTSLADRTRETMFEAGSDAFYALLAADNCKGISFMLKDHARAFGFKTITSIITGGESYIRIVLGPPKL